MVDLSMYVCLIFELYFCINIPLSRHVGYVMDGWISERCMYVTSQIGSTINSHSTCYHLQRVI